MTSLAPGTILGLAALALVAAMGVRWWRLMMAVRIPARRTGWTALSAVAALLATGALAAGAGVAGGIAAALALLGALAFLALSAASGQARAVPAVAVGGPILEFTAPDDAGRAFDLASLRGRPFLLKFFRGHWCPYCTAELRRWEELRPELDARDVVIVTVCADTPEQIRAGRGTHGLRAVMLADPDLAVTDRYRLRNPRGFALKSGVIVPLPIPTTILVDAEGIVRWIDQATDYMVRSEPARVLRALRAADAPSPVVQFRPAAASR